MSKKSRKHSINDRQSTYRVLARQPLSIEVGTACIESLVIQNVRCRLAIRPAHPEPERQRELGGSILAVEFQRGKNADLLMVAREGFELIEDFLSAIAVMSGSTFGPSTLTQVARLDRKGASNCSFIQFIPLPAKHWPKVISEPVIRSARNLLAHWDGLEGGKRLRRAARRYREAAGTLDDVSAFQQAYIGLEAMEPALAGRFGLTAGTEETVGSCEQCGHRYVRKRTSLVGVRAFVHGTADIDKAGEERKAGWKLINTLRNDLMHGRVDDNTLGRRSRDALVASMHFLHDAVAIGSHATSELSSSYELVRGGLKYVILGNYTVESWPALNEWVEVLGASPFTWVMDEAHGLVPQLVINNPGIKDLQIGMGSLGEPLSFATTNDIRKARTNFG